MPWPRYDSRDAIPPRTGRVAPLGLGALRAARMGRARRAHARGAGARRARHRARRGPRAAGHDQRALPRVPARDGGIGRVPRPSHRRLLDLARGDVPARGPGHARRHRGHRAPALRRDAEARLHGGRGIPLPAPRSAGQALRQPRGNRRAHHRGGRAVRHRAHAAARALRVRGLGNRPLAGAQRRFALDADGAVCASSRRSRPSTCPRSC